MKTKEKCGSHRNSKILVVCVSSKPKNTLETRFIPESFSELSAKLTIIPLTHFFYDFDVLGFPWCSAFYIYSGTQNFQFLLFFGKHHSN